MKDSISPFLSDFVKLLTLRHPGEIDYILLSGSAARGDFVKGRSDIDLIVKTKEPSSVWPVLTSADGLFWDLDEKYGMGQRELFVNKRSQQLIPVSKPSAYAVTVFNNIPKKSIFSYFNLHHKALMRARSKPYMTYVFGKGTGNKLVYDDPLSLLITYDLAMSILALLVFPFDPGKAFRASMRAVLFTYDPHIGGMGWKEAIIRESRDCKASEDAVGMLGKISFCLKAPFLILACNLSDIAFKIRTGKLPEAAI